MKILIYYPKTQKTQIFLAETVEIGPSGLTFFNPKSKENPIGFVGFCEDYQISIVKE